MIKMNLDENMLMWLHMFRKNINHMNLLIKGKYPFVHGMWMSITISINKAQIKW